jgi:indole-3-glycerol phosphate synthase
MTRTILEHIVETKRREVAEAKRAAPVEMLHRAITEAPAPRAFYSAVAGGNELSLIAEIKKASPSAGLIRSDFDPVSIARCFEQAGAAALSVLTDRTFFQGELTFIAAIKSAVGLPVLRKDFVIDAYQLHESRAAGADAILLIAAILTVERIDRWSRLACDLGMSSLIEVHNERELDAVRDCLGPDRRAILGINNRDLRAQRTDLQITHRLARALAPGTPFISESGIQDRDDVLALEKAGASALLVGETLMKADDPGQKVRELLGR